MRALRRLRADPEAGFTVAELSIAAVFIVIALSLVSSFLITTLVTQRDETHVILATNQANVVNGNFSKTLPNTLDVAVTAPVTVGADTITYLSGIQITAVADDGTATGHCVAWAYSTKNDALYTRAGDPFTVASAATPNQIPRVNDGDSSTALTHWTLLGGKAEGDSDAYVVSPITQTPDASGDPTAVFTLKSVAAAAAPGGATPSPNAQVLHLVYSIGNAYTGQDTATRNTNAVRISTTIPTGMRAINDLNGIAIDPATNQPVYPSEGCLS